MLMTGTYFFNFTLEENCKKASTQCSTKCIEVLVSGVCCNLKQNREDWGYTCVSIWRPPPNSLFWDNPLFGKWCSHISIIW